MAKSAKKPEKKQFECAVHGKKAPTDEVGAKGASSREADAEEREMPMPDCQQDQYSSFRARMIWPEPSPSSSNRRENDSAGFHTIEWRD